MSFLKRLFGGISSKANSNPAWETEYEGFSIRATPQNEDGQFRLCAEISKSIDGELRTHKLIRADILPSGEEAAQAALRKARQLIDERGDKLFG